MPSLTSALTRKFIRSRSAPRPSVLLAVVKETVLSVSWFIGFLLFRSERFSDTRRPRGSGSCSIQRRASAISRARTGGFQPLRWTSRLQIASYVVRIIDRALLARSAHNLVVEAVDLRLDTTTPLAGPFISPAIDLLLGRLQVTA